MRLIDADDLVKKIYERTYEEDTIFLDELVDGIIGNMETVEAKPHGKWIENTEVTIPETALKAYMCSRCRTITKLNPYIKSYFCPWCGADMREEGEYKGSLMSEAKPMNYHPPELLQLDEESRANLLKFLL